MIGFSGCLAAVIPQYLLEGKFDEARAAAAKFIDIFGKDYFIIELMDHGIEEQRRIIPDLLRIATEFGLKVVATNDVHYVNNKDWEPHDSLLCIQTGAKVRDDKRMRYDAQQFYLKSREEMDLAFKEVPEAITNTSAVAEMCEVKLPFGVDHYPVYERPIEIDSGSDHANFDRVLDIYVEQKNTVLVRDGKPAISLSADERAQHKENGLYLFELCKAGLKERYGTDYDACRADWDRASAADQRYCEQLEYELAIITGTGFVDYFLIVWDFINWAREQGIPVGHGRGSGAGCIVAYMLKITDIDRSFGLLFERCSISNGCPRPISTSTSACGAATAWSTTCATNTAKTGWPISSPSVPSARKWSCATSRGSIEFSEANKLAKMIPDELNISLEDSVRKSPELQQELKTNPVAQTIIEQGRVIEGMVRNTGKHACGVIIADQDITNLIPVTLQEGDLTTQYPKGPSEDLGLLKMDFLGLKTLTVIDDAQTNVRATRNLRTSTSRKSRSPTNPPSTCSTVAALRQSSAGSGYAATLPPDRPQLLRGDHRLDCALPPRPDAIHPAIHRGQKGPLHGTNPPPAAEGPGTGDLRGAGLPGTGHAIGADHCRLYPGRRRHPAPRHGKKIKAVMDAQKDVFIKGAKTTNDIDAKRHRDLRPAEKFAQYGFNKSHSAAYAMLSYRTAYLKANYGRVHGGRAHLRTGQCR